MSTNARMLPWIMRGSVAWQQGTGEAAVLHRMAPGDTIVPKFAQSAAYGDEDAAAQGAVCDKLGLNFEDVEAKYGEVVSGGAGAVPYVLTVTGSAQDDDSTGDTLVKVPVKLEDLKKPLSTQAFLRLRALPHEIAAQFKGTVGRGRHIQEVPHGLTAQVRLAGSGEDVEPLLRKYSLVEAQNVEQASNLLAEVGRPPHDGDAAFLVTRATLPGIAIASNGELVLQHEPIAQPPDTIKPLLEDAQLRAAPKDPFTPAAAMAAAEEIIGVLDGNEKVVPVDDFGRFYDRYRLLTSKINQALALSKRPLPDRPVSADESAAQPPDHEELENPDIAAALAGLSVEAVEATLPNGFFIDRDVVAAAVTALRAGKHLLLGGPPGTGKTTLGEALCRAVVGQNYHVTTATSDWTTFDTIGGYLPEDKGGLRFSPGVVLRALRDSSWLLIDEVNRADIDKAFGPLFTVLSGGEGSATRQSVLPYTDAGQAVTIEWTTSPKGTAVYPLTESWRLIGTLNVSDKASLFKLSFAFLRRFAVIDIPLPGDGDYRKLFNQWFAEASVDIREALIDAALQVVHGPIPIGPAIGRDVARFVLEAVSPTSSGAPAFNSAQEALLTALELMVVPQYEGALLGHGHKLVAMVREGLPDVSDASIGRLKTALEAVALS